MNAQPKAPPYAADTRAKGWRFEIDHERIRQSDTWALSPSELRPWLLMLWMVAWEQTPCGALPKDDELICARIGMSPKFYAKHKALLLRGWEEADDGRLYHPVITQRVTEMMRRRRSDADRQAARRAAESAHSPTEVADVSRVTPTEVRPESSTGTGTSTREETTTEVRAGAKSRRAVRKCPEDFIVTDEMAEWARREVPAVSLVRETEKLRDHTFKTAITDWPGTWRNWMRRAAEGRNVADKGLSFRERDAEVKRAEVAKWTGGILASKPSAEVIEMEAPNAAKRLG